MSIHSLKFTDSDSPMLLTATIYSAVPLVATTVMPST
jgi:hypothetical protein